jgi:hypothetical protein
MDTPRQETISRQDLGIQRDDSAAPRIPPPDVLGSVGPMDDVHAQESQACTESPLGPGRYAGGMTWSVTLEKIIEASAIKVRVV